MKIKTEYWAKPIPSRNCDWSAIDEDTYDAELIDDRWKGGPVGYGATEKEAIDSLMEMLDLCPVCHAPVDCDCTIGDALAAETSSKPEGGCGLQNRPICAWYPHCPCGASALNRGEKR